MALTSPGVQVSVIDESFYTPAEPGTVPMIFVATAANKLNGAGTGIAPGTTKANAGKPYLLTSQRDLTETFGDPTFITDTNNNPIHAGELNEYGLQAAYSMLGVSNRAYVVRADIDLGSLVASANAPAANPANGTYWFDTQITTFGVFQWNGSSALTPGGQTFTNTVPLVLNDETKLVGNSVSGNPKTSVGAIGDYAIVTTTTTNKLFYKNSDGTWVQVGSSAWQKSWPTVSGSSAPSITVDGTFDIRTGATLQTVTTITASEQPLGSGVDVDRMVNIISGAGISGVTAANVDNALVLYSDGTTNIRIDEGTGLAEELGFFSSGDSTETFYPPSINIAPHTSVPAFKTSDSTPRPTGSIWIKTTEPNLGARWRVKKWNADTELWEQVAAPIYASNESALYNLDKSGGGTNLPAGTLYVQSSVAEGTDILATFTIKERSNAGATVIRSSAITGVSDTGGNAGTDTYNFDIQETKSGETALATAKTISVQMTNATGDADIIAGAINSAGFTHVTAEVDNLNRLSIKHNAGGDFRIADTDGLFGDIGFAAFNYTTLAGTPNLYAKPTGDTTNDFVASNWKVLTYTAGDDAPTALTADGALWYNSIVDEADIMINDGSDWVGYQSATSPFFASAEGDKTDPAGPIVSASEPTVQSDGTALKNGDLWIDTSDLENYPKIYKFNGTTLAWVLVDSADQTTEDGVVFADARYNTAGSNSDTAGLIGDLLVSDFVDGDCPDPALYPKGMLLFNTRRSGFNVKKFVRNYINTAEDNARSGESQDAYYPHRWVTESGNQADGSGSFGRKAQRKVVVQALQAMVNSNDDIRDDESRVFNLMATPGYPELIGEMISLNYDRGLTAFIIGDSPPRLTPDATSLNEWATNVNLAVEDNDKGLVSRDEYFGMFYPWGFSSDNAGNNVVVPPSHMMLRTIALSDQVSYPWFAPAGTRRGGITNATATGYVDAEGEFVSIALNEGQRDTLYAQNVNPITFITGAGLVNFGQKTRARGSSALDRINVARLVIYLRSQLNKLAKPYIFEPNDKITRDQIKQAAESLMLELVGARGLYDYLVVCDESNNTPTRIDRNELYLDIAIEPVKAVEFIYIPLRLKNTGEIAGL